MKINVIADKPVLKEPKVGYVYKHIRREGFWLGVKHPQIASNHVVLVSLSTLENWWCSSGAGGFGAADSSEFVEVGKLTVEN